MLNRKESYKVFNHTGRWSLIDEYKGYGLLEHDYYGDETCYLVVSLNAPVEMKKYITKTGDKIELPTIMEIVGESYDGLEVALEDYDLI